MTAYPPDLEWDGLVAPDPPPDSMLTRPWTAEQRADHDARLGSVEDPGLVYSDGRPIPEPDVKLGPDETAALMARVLAPVTVERLGTAFRVTIRPFGATFVFRDLTPGRELAADVAVYRGDERIFRSGSTLSLTGRKTIAKVAAEMGGGDAGDWQAATFAAVEAALEAHEQLSAGVDLRTADTDGPGTGWLARPFLTMGAAFFIAPGESGKSTIGRAVAVSVADGREVIPGITPEVTGPVLYVVSEDPSHEYHARSIEAICRGVGIDRGRIAHPITFIAARGRPLHRLVRSVSERAADAALVILDAQQGFMGTDENGNVRDQAARYWNAVDEIARPSLTIAHPNLAHARDWNRSDGRAAGSEVNRDRPRIAWMAHWKDEPAAIGTSFRRYQLGCTKFNNGPKPAPISFAAAWEFGIGYDPGALRFVGAEPLEDGDDEPEPTPKERDTIAAWRAGARTPAAMGRALGIDSNTAKARIRRCRDKKFLPADAIEEAAA